MKLYVKQGTILLSSTVVVTGVMFALLFSAEDFRVLFSSPGLFLKLGFKPYLLLLSISLLMMSVAAFFTPLIIEEIIKNAKLDWDPACPPFKEEFLELGVFAGKNHSAIPIVSSNYQKEEKVKLSKIEESKMAAQADVMDFFEKMEENTAPEEIKKQEVRTEEKDLKSKSIDINTEDMF